MACSIGYSKDGTMFAYCTREKVGAPKAGLQELERGK
jgi:hypothetical protein